MFAIKATPKSNNPKGKPKLMVNAHIGREGGALDIAIFQTPRDAGPYLDNATQVYGEYWNHKVVRHDS